MTAWVPRLVMVSWDLLVSYVRAISRDAGDFLLIGDLLQKHRQNRSIADLVSRHFYGPDFH
ncbi:hypothetical protein AD934_00250 [Gluconobacter oxydans]|uniref:Uncharacterized protein n=1 Tax=Gluconobacter oxydans TaxID=442 RepID=A0A149S9I7_GLUOY|nr:hypothetical protein AD934_00250 [Gluconobacter oxydans]